MSQASTLKGPTITGLDLIPATYPTTGEGGPGYLRTVNDWVTPLSADTTSSTYRLCRIPTVAKIKSVIVNSAIATAGAADIDIAYSDSTTDGTPPSLSSLANPVVIIPSNDNKLFGSAQSLVGTGQAVNQTWLGTFTAAHSNLPLWQVLVNLGTTQFAADPGGYFDIYFKVTTAITTGGVLACKVEYVI